jgi:hypothetical protein
LLGTIMEVAFHSTSFGVGGGDNPCAGGAELVGESFALSQPVEHLVEAVGERSQPVSVEHRDRCAEVAAADAPRRSRQRPDRAPIG